MNRAMHLGVVEEEGRAAVVRVHSRGAPAETGAYARRAAPAPTVAELLGRNSALEVRLSECEAELEEAYSERELLVSELGAVNAELEQVVRMLEMQAVTDPLTGVYNKRHMWAHLGREIARAQRSGRPLAVLFADIDHFKRINDTWGHSTGDEVLRQIADILRTGVRVTDSIGSEGITSRFGGEEFVVVLTEADAAAARVVADRLRERVASTAFVGSAEEVLPQITISIGVSEYHPRDEASYQPLLDRADEALYEAKRTGRNRVVVRAL